MTAGFDFSCSLSCRAAEAAYNTCALHTVMAVVGILFYFILTANCVDIRVTAGACVIQCRSTIVLNVILIIHTVNPINEMIKLH